MLADLEKYLEPISEDQPSGPDLSYDSERSAIESRFDSSFSDDATGVQDVNWSDVIDQIGKQLDKTKDIWLPIYMMRAGAQAGKLEIIALGAELLAGLLERYWESLHPQLEDLGLPGRITPCSSLTRIGEFLGPFRRTVIATHPRLGSYSGADFERFERNGDAEPDYGMFRAAMNEIEPVEIASAVEYLDRIKASLKRTDAFFADQTDGDGPNFQATYETLDQIRRAVAVYTGSVASDADKDEANADAGSIDERRAGAGGMSGRIETRDDVVRALDSIADYYRRKEPSSPVPVALQRARHWVMLDFLAILEDIAPGSMDEAKRVLVFAKEQGNEWN